MPIETPVDADISENVVCRPSGELGSMVGLAFSFTIIDGLALILPSNPPLANPIAQTIFFGVLCICSFLAGILILWWMINAQILADSNGLRWRGIVGWKSVRWDQVVDYYEKQPTPARHGSRSRPLTIGSVIETSTAKFGFTNLWSQADALRAQIVQRAIQSRAISWELKGTRVVDSWPVVFDYDTRENRWAPRIWLKLFLIYVVYLLIQPALKLNVMAGSIGWTMTFITAGLYLLLIGSLGLIFLLPLAQYRAAGRRKRERITVDLSGIVFEDGLRRLEAAWPDVTGYHIASGQGILARYVVQTCQGDFDFLPSVGNAALLLAIIQRFAVQTPVHDWKSLTDVNALGGESARWSGGKIGSGAHVYHYRTRVNRALLWMPLMFCLVLWLIAGLIWQGLLTGQSASGPLLFGAGNGLGFLFAYYAYRLCRIESDDEGLTQITMFGKRRLRWGQVEQYSVTKEQGGVVTGYAHRIRFSAQIVGYEDLKAEIQRRSTECGGKVFRDL